MPAFTATRRIGFLALFLALPLFLHPPLLQAQSFDRNDSGVEVFELTSDQQADQFSSQLLGELRATPDGQVLVVRLAQLEKDGQLLNPYLKRALITLDLESVRQGLDKKLRLSAHRTQEMELQSTIEATVGLMPDETKVAEYLIQYEQNTHQNLDPDAKAEIKAHFSQPNLRSRIRARLNRFFGTPLGVTVVDHFIEKTENVTEDKVSHTYSIKNGLKNRPWFLALSTALIGMTSFTLGTTVSAFGGHLDFGGPVYLRTVGILGAWIFTCLSFSRELASVKTQGREIRLKETESPQENSLQISPNYRMFLRGSLVQEAIAVTLVTAGFIGIGGFVQPDVEGFAENILFPILLTATASALSNTFFDLWAGPYWNKMGQESARAELLLKDGKAEAAAVAAKESKVASKIANRITAFWYNLLYPAARWSGVNGASAGWFSANRGFLTVIGVTSLIRAWRSRTAISENFSNVLDTIFGREKTFEADCNGILVTRRADDLVPGPSQP